jgi:hypothetical protein
MGAPYWWEITKDHIRDESRPEGTNCNAKGMAGPRGGDRTITANPAHFKMYDDDCILYYEGMIYGDYEGLEPIEDFGQWNAGCVRIKINGEWV